MELLFEILLFIVFIALIVIGEIYLGLDKYKTRATVFIKKMTGSLDAWVNCTVELAESSEAGRKSADALHTLAQNYFSCKKYKDTPKKIALVNSIAALSDHFARVSSGAEAVRLLNARSDAAANIDPLRSEYNKSVKKLNLRLDKKITARIGKLFHVSKFAELRELSKA